MGGRGSERERERGRERESPLDRAAGEEEALANHASGLPHISVTSAVSLIQGIEPALAV